MPQPGGAQAKPVKTPDSKIIPQRHVGGILGALKNAKQ